ncbi:hypothetical protein [Streptomyces sp. NPDC050738]|uniref:hypothetical protein n=1 Tax=Streptomyces sp. NPDC050738 TaxID=3154744 RepID=UPI003421730A
MEFPHALHVFHDLLYSRIASRRVPGPASARIHPKTGTFTAGTRTGLRTWIGDPSPLSV